LHSPVRREQLPPEFDQFGGRELEFLAVGEMAFDRHSRPITACPRAVSIVNAASRTHNNGGLMVGSYC
jgi:hypothetical protein